MKPLKNAFNETCAQWMRKYSYLKIGVKDIVGLVNIAFTKIFRMELAKSAFACTGFCPLNHGIFSDLDFLPLSGLDFSDSQHAGTAFPDAKDDSTPVFDPEIFPATIGSESLPSPKYLPAASTSQSLLQKFAASSSQSPTEPLFPQTAEDLLNRSPKQCNSHQ
jgi:hypothetical protein